MFSFASIRAAIPGLMLGVLLGAGLSAAAEDSGETVAPRAQQALRCRVFVHPLDPDLEVDIDDGTTPAGQWVSEERGDGWRLHSVDFEVAPKPTGFLQGYHHVCLTR